MAFAGSAFAAPDIPQDILSKRDPFKMPNIAKGEGPHSALESFPTEQFKLLGILNGPTQRRAMIAAPNGRTYFVKEKMAIGQRSGVIKKITDSSILVREKTLNVLGAEENVETVLKLPSDVKQDVTTITSEHGW